MFNKSLHSKNRISIGLIVVGILLIISIGSCSHKNQNNCRKFRTGNYYLHSRYNGLEYTLERTDSFQTEISKETGIKSKWKITWISACEYKLIFESRDLDTAKRINPSFILPDLNYKIIATSENYYVFSCAFPNDPVPIIDTIWIVNNKK